MMATIIDCLGIDFKQFSKWKKAFLMELKG